MGMKWMQRSIVALLVAGALSLGLAGPAAAQRQDGLVNVIIEDIDVCVPILVAANTVVQACDLDAFVVVLGQIRAVDASGRAREFCTVGDDPVTVTQNTTCPD
jgi:hypothetical protein